MNTFSTFIHKQMKFGKRESVEDPVAAAKKKKKGDDGKAVAIPREEVCSTSVLVFVDLSLEHLRSELRWCATQIGKIII